MHTRLRVLQRPTSPECARPNYNILRLTVFKDFEVSVSIRSRLPAAVTPAR